MDRCLTERYNKNNFLVKLHGCCFFLFTQQYPKDMSEQDDRE